MGMTSRERVIRTLEFQPVDRPARDVWVLPAAYYGREKELRALLALYPSDFGGSGFENPVDESPLYQPGAWTDEWGSHWTNIQAGMIGEVKHAALADWSALDHWQPPFELLGKGFDNVNRVCAESTKFTTLGLPRPWERLQFVRGSQAAYMDLAMGDARIFKVLEMIHDYYMRHLEYVVKTDVDAMFFMDDWGSAKSLLISPKMWVEYFKPLYQEYCDFAHAHNKYVVMHSDGYIMDIYPHLIKMGVNAVNSQLFAMPIEEIAAKYRGQIAFWGEMDRQSILPFGTPDDVRAAVQRVKDAFGVQGGGLIGQAEFNKGYPMENIRAFFEAWWGEPEEGAGPSAGAWSPGGLDDRK